ncbi:MAG TPA: 2-phosphosulfolactate phosphatase [Actinomycetes bacterium]|nr:2-phosphosulfolactate phosphatase [Actinomycetes bacterium]
MTLSVGLEWGPQGMRQLSERCECVVIVDVLSFSTSVAVAVARGAAVWPHSGNERAEELARAIGATLVRGRNMREGRTLSPASLLDVASGERLIMPSANGSVISHAALMSGLTVVAGSLRNATAVAEWLDGRFESVGLVPAGEQWADGTMRVCYEDLVGAGAIASRLRDRGVEADFSPDVLAAAAAFDCRGSLADVPSGRELVDRGFADDVTLSEMVDADPVVPVLRDGRYVSADD